jgi:hypothetical protein
MSDCRLYNPSLLCRKRGQNALNEWYQPVEERLAQAYIAVRGELAYLERFLLEGPVLSLAGGYFAVNSKAWKLK